MTSILMALGAENESTAPCVCGKVDSCFNLFLYEHRGGLCYLRP